LVIGELPLFELHLLKGTRASKASDGRFALVFYEKQNCFADPMTSSRQSAEALAVTSAQQKIVPGAPDV
jgi:hypothetical protein